MRPFKFIVTGSYYRNYECPECGYLMPRIEYWKAPRNSKGRFQRDFLVCKCNICEFKLVLGEWFRTIDEIKRVPYLEGEHGLKSYRNIIEYKLRSEYRRMILEGELP